jgi:tRNA(Ile)-lysidine synthase
MRDLIDTLRARLAELPPGPIAVAYSGGMDSSALLHALAQIPEAGVRGLRALHVDHGLHPDSAAWADHCRTFAAALGIAFECRSVTVAETGTGREDAARRARHAAYAEALEPGATLALAHHADDQAETILLKLLRGAGPEGLGGMRRLRVFANGRLWRPLLDVPRSVLEKYARACGFGWIDDPSNADISLARNFLRREILPHLRPQWPDATLALAHSAAWARAAADYIDGEARRALARLRGADPATLAWRAWLELPDALRDPVLRLWRDLGLAEPAHVHVTELERQLREADPDRAPRLNWPGTELRRFRKLLYAMAPLATLPKEWETDWDGRALRLPAGGSIALRDDAGADARVSPLCVRYRRGGERLKPAGGAHHRELRLLLQEAGIPPWLRARTPLVYSGPDLIAAGDLVLSDAAAALCAKSGARIVWARED